MIVQYHAATSGSRRPIPRFSLRVRELVFSGRSSKLSFTQWFISMVISTVFRCVLAVNVILNELDVATNKSELFLKPHIFLPGFMWKGP